MAILVRRSRIANLAFLLMAAVVLSLAASCSSHDTLFLKRSSSFTGITFNNKITENDSINPIDLEFLYNGGGVAAGDFNNDGAADLYFTGSVVSNKLYLNSGDFKFKDITEQAKVTGEGRWANGVSVVDINNDGWLDIYISNSISADPLQRRNLLYINRGAGKDGLPVFTDMAEAYGLADTSYSVQAAFFDYDNDGDLDMYLLTTKLAKRDGTRFFSNNYATDTLKTDVDKLFRNDWSASLNHPVFTDVSRAAGIVHPGFGLGLAIADINKDGWKDIYVTNDFYGSDLLYINNKNGSFSNKVDSCLKHTSQNAMGNDIADINNDGLADIIAVDMNPEDNFRKKKNMNGSNYNIYQNMIIGGYNIQYVRNTLQLNMGPRILEGDSTGDPVFGDIGFFAGVAETDWSWNPSLADMDNDGLRDIIITNGYPRDVTDHDFAAFRGRMGNNATKEQLIAKMPQIRIRNYAFKNKDGLRFENSTDNWGLTDLSFSSGAVYADLDNDGDLDYVINNINEQAFVYENTLIKKGRPPDTHYLNVTYKGPANNLLGLGAIAEIFYDQGKLQVHENFSCRGYLSSVETKAHFGLSAVTTVDSLLITWPNRRFEVLHNVAVDREIVADYRNSSPAVHNTPTATLRDFKDITSASGISYIHRETDYVDFNEQRLLPHKLSQYGPGLAAGDIDGNGLDDIFIGGTGDNQGNFFFQQPNGTFIKQPLPRMIGKDVRNPENMGILFFDADGDGDLDIHFANGSNEFIKNSKSYEDRFLVNDGRGKMHWDTAALPLNYASKSCVKAADFDRDGDLDLFIGGRLSPGRYPEPVSSFIYRNDTKDGVLKFTDVTADIAPELQHIGMVCDALWTDYDNDGFKDLILAGEWMPVTIFKNIQGKFKNITREAGLSSFVGWWNSISGADFDNDGDIDYIVGNLGTNSFLRASNDRPVSIFAKDFDNNGSLDIIPAIYLPGKDGKVAEYPVHTRDDVVEQLPGLKKSFLSYKDFGTADIQAIFRKQLDTALTLRANFFQTACLRNNGKGRFTVEALPAVFQLAPIYGMVIDDFNADGNLDLAVCGNDYGGEVSNGRYDAINGIVAYGDGRGRFGPRSIAESGFFMSGDAKALVKLRGADGALLLAGTQNRGPLKIFRNSGKESSQLLNNDDDFLSIQLTNGGFRKEELYHGTSFLSQSSRFISISPLIKSVEVVNSKGIKRLMYNRK